MTGAEMSGEFIRRHGITLLLFASCVAQMLCLMAMKSTISLFILYLGGTTFMAGILSTVLVICGLVVKPAVGFALDKVGPKPMYFYTAILTILSSFAHFVSAGSSILGIGILGIVLTGIGYSTMSTISVPIFLLRSQMHEQNKYMINLAGFKTVLVTAVAPTMSQEILYRWGFQPLYLTLIAISIGGILLNACIMSKLPRRQEISAPDCIKAVCNSVWKVIFTAPFLLLFFANVAWGMTNGLLLTFLIPFGVEKGLNNAGLFFTIYSATNIALRGFVPRYMDKIGRKWLLISSFAFMVPGTMGLALLNQQTDLILPALLNGIGTCAVYTPLVSLVLDYLPEEGKMSGLGIFLAAFEVGHGLTSLLVGIMSTLWGYEMIFAVIGLVPLLGIAAICLGVNKNTQ
ncbi:MFS transporter [Petroclostridium sp. X23]|uniref:MFS transporter n=1 Tax=Petroclostridium sp. X23 TaxID=3045146 RepID=UPI0024AE35C7|nr:MFS transporter [Petroclostridium sp. X23]WHH60913.1 MFS transporter [Petroclostridium sp. X23]